MSADPVNRGLGDPEACVGFGSWGVARTPRFLLPRTKIGKSQSHAHPQILGLYCHAHPQLLRLNSHAHPHFLKNNFFDLNDLGWGLFVVFRIWSGGCGGRKHRNVFPFWIGGCPARIFSIHVRVRVSLEASRAPPFFEKLQKIEIVSFLNKSFC